MKVLSASLAMVCLLSSSSYAIQLTQRDPEEDKALAAIQAAINQEATDETQGEGAVDATQAAIDAAENEQTPKAAAPAAKEGGEENV